MSLKKSRFIPALEPLESRELLTRMIALDFNGATRADLDETLRTIPGWRTPGTPAVTGMDPRSFVGEFAALQTQYGGFSTYNFLDMNSDGKLNATDGELAAQEITARVADRFLAYDVHITRNDNSVEAARQLINNGVAGDALILAFGWHGEGGGGQMPRDVGNTRDDVGEVGGSVGMARWVVKKGLTGTAAREDYLNNLANFIAHEAGHSFGLDHINVTEQEEAQGQDIMTPNVGGEVLRFQDVSYAAEDGGVQNSHQYLSNTLGQRLPVWKQQFVWLDQGKLSLLHTVTNTRTVIDTGVSGYAVVSGSIYSLTASGQVKKYLGSGTSWSTITGANTKVSALVAVKSGPTANRGLYMLANNGGTNQVWRYSGSGTNWSAVTGTNTMVQQIVAAGDGLYMRAGDARIWKYSGPGTTWTAVTGTNTTAHALSSAGNKVYMWAFRLGDVRARVWQYSNSGTSWSAVSGNNTQVLGIVSAGNKLYMLGDNGSGKKVWLYNGASSWTAITGLNTTVAELVAQGDMVYMSASNGGVRQVWQYRGFGSEWRALTSTNTAVSNIWGDATGLYMSAPTGGTLRTWKYAGTPFSWTLLA